MKKPKSSPNRPSRKQRHVYVQLHGPASAADDGGDSGDTTHPNGPILSPSPVLHVHAQLENFAAGDELHLHILGDSGDTTQPNGPVIHVYMPGSSSLGEATDEIA